MTAEEIREMHWTLRDSEAENLFRMLREIGAQIAELREFLGRIGPVAAPKSRSQK